MDIIGHKFGRLLTITKNKEASKIHNRYYVDCKCDCGNMVTVNASSLIRGTVQSCGCLKKEKSKRQTEIYMNNEKGYGIAFINNRGCNDYFIVFSSEDKDIVQNGAWHITGEYIRGYDREGLIIQRISLYIEKLHLNIMT